MENQSNTSVTFNNASVLTGTHLASIVDKMARDMKFYAIFYIIYGALMCLSIVGAIIGIPFIIYSLKLKDAAEEYQTFVQQKDFFMLNKAFENQQKFFFFHKILIIIGLVFFALYILLIIFIGTSMMMPGSGDFALLF